MGHPNLSPRLATTQTQVVHELRPVSGNRKDLKCVRRRRRRPSVSIDSYVQYILFSFYTIVEFTQYITLLFTFFIITCT